MAEFSNEVFVATLALVGVVIVVAALLSGFIERSGLPQVAVLLGLGAVLGPAGMGLLDVQLDSPILRVVATLSLVLVLFTDALTIDLRELRQYRTLALIVLGPGTLLSAIFVSAAGWWLLGLAPAAAVILGASLSSTDPVLLRGLLRRRDVPPSARQALRLESGLNDVVLLPLVLVAAVFLNPEVGDRDRLGANVLSICFLLGPGAGVVVGLLAVATLDLVRRRIGVRRDYESLFALGVAFSAYAAAEALHGSGFLAAFAAGLTISALDIELCDCFLEYGETTAELALLFTFVLFGSSLIWSGFSVLSWGLVAFAVLALLVRPVAFLLSLAPLHIDRRSRLLIAWFGPRGLSSLLLVLLVVFQGLPGSEYLFQICSVVVLLSVLLHGFSPFVLDRKQGRSQESGVRSQESEALVQHEQTNSEMTSSAPTLLVPTVPEQMVRDKERISLDEYNALRAAGKAVYLVDVRTERSLGRSAEQAAGAMRMPPDHVADRAVELRLPKEAWIVLYCTGTSEGTSARVAHDLQQAGWTKARALIGGWDGWQQAGMPVESRPAVAEPVGGRCGLGRSMLRPNEGICCGRCACGGASADRGGGSGRLLYAASA
ncbi:hypothetical protein HC891_12660 [Candidatus Gracilibacteria bacterium]|nr:hypothetical protein [Candidatus Gracilibacteria bacterium]